MAAKFLYSTQSLVALYINRLFYGDIHFVWVSEVLHDDGTPASSSPWKLYLEFWNIALHNDKGSTLRAKHKVSLRTGADIQHGKGVLDDAQHELVKKFIDSLDTDYSSFRPRLLVIDRSDISAGRLIIPPPEKKANPLSPEFIVEDLRPSEFEVLDIPLP